MSTQYYIYCKSCDNKCYTEFESYELQDMRNIIGYKNDIANALPLLKNTTIQLTIGLNTRYVDAEWFSNHCAHEIRVINEYGALDETCGQYIKCPHCKHSKYCTLAVNHPGEHSCLKD